MTTRLLPKKAIKLLPLFLIVCVQFSFAQKEKDQYPSAEVIDQTYGIMMYESLNSMLGSDTIRNDKNGYVINGYRSDFYTSGELLHKGYYVDGKLTIYKNYYPNGNLERSFRLLDVKRSKMILYYEDGSKKSEINYIHNQAQKWQDFYPNGNLEFIEEYHKSMQYHKLKANYNQDGSVSEMLELTDKKKLMYLQTIYHKNQKIKEQGKVKYNKAQFDYEKTGKWIVYDENGTPIKEQNYASGKINSEKQL